MTRSLRRGIMSAGSATADAYLASLLEDSPLGLWMLNEPSGTTVVDSSGNGHNGSYTGSLALAQTSIIPTTADTCPDFTGGNCSISTTGGWTSAVDAATIEAVVELDVDTGDHGIVTRYASGTILCLYQSNGSLYMESRNESSTGFYTSTTGLTAGVATHVAVTVPSGGGNAQIYVNGVASGAPVAVTGNLKKVTAPILIGRLNSIYPVNGSIQGVAFYDTALSTERILAHATAAGLAA